MSPSAAPLMLQPRTAEDVAEAIRGHKKILPIGAGTKPALAAPPSGTVALSLRGIAGLVEYEPGEYTFTALAGTPLNEIEAELARHGQYLPFDPPFADLGATLGGTIAAGLSGPGRHRYGGMRDFILGVRFVTGLGEIVRGGGKVVKNAAGFDLPKLLVGSLGRLGAIIEATCKVFPRPRATATLLTDTGGLAAALTAVGRLAASPFDVEALEFDAGGVMAIRLGGAAETFADRLDRLAQFVGGRAERFEGPGDAALWRELPPRLPASETDLLVKVPVTLRVIPEFDRLIAAGGARRRYSTGGNLAWVTWPGPAAEFSALLSSCGLAGLVLAGPTAGPLLGHTRGDGFRRRVKSALDPENHFPDF
jgi:glycolate oxidase FAD binding subunit